MHVSANLGAPSVLFVPACTCSAHLPSQALPLSLQMGLEIQELENILWLGEWDEMFRFGWCVFFLSVWREWQWEGISLVLWSPAWCQLGK